MEFMPDIVNLTNFFTGLSQEKSIKYFFLLIDGENLSFFLLDMIH